MAKTYDVSTPIKSSPGDLPGCICCARAQDGGLASTLSSSHPPFGAGWRSVRAVKAACSAYVLGQVYLGG